MTTQKLKAGDWVEVRSEEEILATLDDRGRLGELPFMPEMFDFCGQRFQIFKRAHKTCDTVNKTGGRRVEDAVHLAGVFCHGRAHGGCDASCLIFWNTAWLEPVDGPAGASADRRAPAARTRGPDRSAVTAAARKPHSDDADPTYVCQATELPKFTTLLPWWDLRQYVEDYTSGNESLRALAGGAAYVGFFTLFRLSRRFGGQPAMMRLYDRVQKLRGGLPFPRKVGKVPATEKTPHRRLDLVQGECVRVKSYDEILGTLDGSNKNRGLYFDAEEVPYCGKTMRVRSRVDRIVDERTGKMIPIKGGTVVLEGAYCMGHYSDRRMFCPRAIFSFWRETWLERA